MVRRGEEEDPPKTNCEQQNDDHCGHSVNSLLVSNDALELSGLTNILFGCECAQQSQMTILFGLQHKI